MRHGSTLIPGMLPDTRDMMTEQVLATPSGSAMSTFWRMLFLLAITLGFDFFMEHFVMWVFLVGMVGNDLQDMRAGEARTADLLVTYATYWAFEPIVFCPIALGLVLYQAILFTRHWVHIRTTHPCSCDMALRIRAELRATLPRSIVLFPITALRGIAGIANHPGQAWHSWKSYLNYGKRGTRAAGEFRSPAGSHRFRMHLFYICGAAMSLSILHIPVPYAGVDTDLTIALAILLLGPTLICLFVPLLLAAPHFDKLTRTEDEG